MERDLSRVHHLMNVLEVNMVQTFLLSRHKTKQRSISKVIIIEEISEFRTSESKLTTTRDQIIARKARKKQATSLEKISEKSTTGTNR
ncbi:unnamed protein product [Albugo candida]|uniref:Uncharacterized protein n=1 Tax=Albugo candida TaxID=65357 RepID=A0A024FWG1_9STRA|nr:unnamed protein product [Albugo candida]|eukprot:CCI11478.1 unnamed protein product [Albugo candida]